MKTVLDQIARRKLLCVIEEEGNTRLFSFEFPVDANAEELLEVVTDLRNQLEEVIKKSEEEKAKEAKKDQIDDDPHVDLSHLAE